MYAIVDIETTGGSAASSKIIEIAIVLHNGKEVVERYSTLLNPKCRIPYYITQVTGINDEMVRDAPAFYEVAKHIIELTKDATFVAHNCAFDYSFVRAAYKDLGYDYNRKTLCTVKLSKSTFKGLPSYSLGNLCERLDIHIKDRHRALGDAEATAILFGKILTLNSSVSHQTSLLLDTPKRNIPPLLNESVLDKIPSGITGVYYFYNQTGDVIYVGKSNDIKKRIMQHFASKSGGKALRMLHEMADISFENTGSELVALLLESDEIKRIKPFYNRAQKRATSSSYYGIYESMDDKHYLQLKIERYRDDRESLLTFDNLNMAKASLNKAVENFQLCLSKCDLHAFSGPCFNYQIKKCKGACAEIEEAESYNKRVTLAIDSFNFQNKSFFLIGNGRNQNEKSMVCIEKGQYIGFGYLDLRYTQNNLAEMASCIKRYKHNRDIQKILSALMSKYVKIEYQPSDISSF